MFIIPNRKMYLDGRGVVAGQIEKVSAPEGALAVRHGWAVETDAPKKSDKKPKKSGELEDALGDVDDAPDLEAD